MIGTRGVAITLSLVLASPVAHAGGTTADVEHAASLVYDEGKAAFRARDYDAAAAAFARAYELAHLPGFLYDQAIATRRAGRCSDAVELFQRYTRLDPEDARRRGVERALVELQPCPAPIAPPPIPIGPGASPAPVLPPAPPTLVVPMSRAPHAQRVAAASLVGLGAALTLSGGALLGAATGRFDDLRSSCGPSCAPGTWQGWERATTASYALLGVGSAVLAGATVWLALSFRARRDHRP